MEFSWAVQAALLRSLTAKIQVVSDSAELLEEFSCVSGRATGMGSGSGTIEDWQLVSLVGEFPEKGLVSPADRVDNSRMSASIVESLVESETCAA